MHKVFAWQLLPVGLSRKTVSGKEKPVQSFKIEYQIDQEALNGQSWLNGFLCFVTDQPAENLSLYGNNQLLPAQKQNRGSFSRNQTLP